MENLIPAILFTLAGGVSLFLGMRAGRARRRLARECQQWPGTSGRITKSEVAVDSSGDSTTYRPRVQYEYRVHDQPYCGQRLSFRGVEFIRRAAAQSIADRYAPGTPVEVFYDPKQPGMSVLDRQSPSTRGPAGAILAGLFLLFVGMPLMFTLLPPDSWLRRAADRFREQVTIGRQDHVAYRGDATAQDARRIGEALRAKGYFQDKGAYVYVRKGKDGAFLSFEVTKGTWDNPSYVAAFEELGRQMAPVVSAGPLKIELGYEVDPGEGTSHYQAMTTIAIARNH